MKYYAVKEGKEKGIYTTWDECLENTKGFKGAKYKSFTVMEDAEKYMSSEDGDLVQLSATEIKSINNISDNEMIAYTDGSFNQELNISSYGVVCLSKKSDDYLFSGLVNDKLGTRNVIGEITGVLQAIEYAIFKEKVKVYIYHDYEGLSKWYTGEWKMKNAESVKYVDKLKIFASQIDIEFVKVKAHSGNYYNEICDKLAKNEIKSLEPSIKDEWGFKSYKYSDSIIEITLNKIKKMCSEFTYSINNKNNHNVINCFLGKEKLTFQKYKFDSGNKLLIPNNQSDKIYSLIITFLNDHNSVDAMILSLNSNNNTNVSLDTLKNRLYTIVPSLKGVLLNVSIYKLLVQSTYNLFLTIPTVEDSSFLTTPVLRALEGQLKLVFKNELNLDIENNGFHYFDKLSDGSYSLQQKYKAQLKIECINYIDECYNKYNMIRHKLLHFGDLDIEDTKLLNTEESKKIISDTIILIGKYYE